MPSLIDIRRRIRSVQNTQQITKAMKMVSTAKLRRAQDRVIAARPYAAMMQQVLSNVAAAAMADEKLKAHPLLARRTEQRVQLVLLTSDRGLAGAFNSNLIKAAMQFVNSRPPGSVQVEVIGRKGADFFRKRPGLLSGEYIGIADKARYSDAAGIAGKLIGRYQNAEVDAVHLLFNEFRSVLSQKLFETRLLPVELAAEGGGRDYIYEQPPEQLLATLLPRYVEVGLYRAMLESAAAEHAARMTAMDAATTNAGDVIDKLTLFMNRVRQASITKEIIEVVSGSAALE